MTALRCFLLGMCVAAAPSAVAQTAPPITLPVHSPAVDASAEGSRLRQTESIYQQQLRSRHIPLLGSYVTTLQRLAASAPDPLPYQQEIERIQAIISGGGVVDLAAAAQSLRQTEQMPMPTPMPPPRRVQRALIALTPLLARSISPLPSGSASPAAAAIGEIEWRIETLPPGTYDLVLQYAIPAAGTSIRGELEFAGQKLKIELDATNATPRGTFPLLRLGQITLEREARGETLTVRAGAKDSPALLIRELVIARARANP